MFFFYISYVGIYLEYNQLICLIIGECLIGKRLL